MERDLGTNEQLWQAILLVDDFFKGFPYRMDSLLPLRELAKAVRWAGVAGADKWEGQRYKRTGRNLEG